MSLEPTPSVALRPSAAADATDLYRVLAPLVASVQGCRLEAVRDERGEWFTSDGPAGAGPTAPVADRRHGSAGTVERWSGVFDLGRGDGSGAMMVVTAPVEPTASRVLRLRAISLRHGVASACRATAELCDRARRLLAAMDTVVSENETLRLLHAAQRRMASAAGDGVGGVVRSLAESCGRAVGVWDGTTRVAAFAGAHTRPDPGARRPTLPDPLVERRAFHSDGWLCCAAHLPDGSFAVIAIADPDRAVGPVGAALVESAISFVAHDLALLRRLPTDPGEDLARALVAGADEAAVQASAAALGYDLGRPHQVGVVVCDPPAARMTEHVRRAGRAQGATVLAAAVLDGAAVVSAARLDWEALAADLRAHVGPGRLAVATSSWRPRAEGLGEALDEARTALRLAGPGATGAVVHFDDLGVVRVLAAGGDTAALRRFVDRWLGPLVAYDRRRGTDLVRTVAVYLDSGGSVGQAAEALFVHPSTLKYRLARVGELTGLDLGDPDTRFQLQLAGRAHTALAALDGERPPEQPAP